MLRAWILIAFLFALAPASLWAQKYDAAKLLGQGTEKGSLPIWTAPAADAREKLGDIARQGEPGVMLVGAPKIGFGTAWVVSKEHRLLVTNAHVADLFARSKGKMYAIPSGTAQVYQVEKFWYHPGVRRFVKDAPEFSVRSLDPKVGPVDPQSPDVALLQLKSDGPELPYEFTMATPEELKTLFAKPAAILGFPASDTAGWPEPGGKVACTFHDGAVSRITDFQLDASAAEQDKLFVQDTMSSWSGFSGSPVFLPNGHVAAIHNMSRTAQRRGEARFIAHGIRIDTVWELLVHHSLADKVALPVDAKNVSLDRWLKPDERTEKARVNFSKAVALVAQAHQLIYEKEEYKAAVEKCDAALELAPSYAEAYSMRATGLIEYCFKFKIDISEKEKTAVLNGLLADSEEAVRLNPARPDYVVGLCGAYNAIGSETKDRSWYEKSLAVLDKLLTAPNLPLANRAEAHSSRGVALGNLDLAEDAQRDLSEAIRLDPKSSIHRANRARFFEARARADFGRAKELREKELEATGVKP